jgi:hypothetical protein
MSDDSPGWVGACNFDTAPGKKVPMIVYPRASKLENLGKNLASALH